VGLEFLSRFLLAELARRTSLKPLDFEHVRHTYQDLSHCFHGAELLLDPIRFHCPYWYWFEKLPDVADADASNKKVKMARLNEQYSFLARRDKD
jgi:hypothetical protein